MDSGILDLIDKAGTLGLMIAVFVGGVRQWWVFGHHYRELQADREQWRTLALEGRSISVHALQVATKAAGAPTA